MNSLSEVCLLRKTVQKFIAPNRYLLHGGIQDGDVESPLDMVQPGGIILELFKDPFIKSVRSLQV